MNSKHFAHILIFCFDLVILLMICLCCGYVVRLGKFIPDIDLNSLEQIVLVMYTSTYVSAFSVACVVRLQKYVQNVDFNALRSM